MSGKNPSPNRWMASRSASTTHRLFFLIQIKHDGVDAVAQVCRAGAVVEDVPQVSIATCAENLCAYHPVAGINFGADIILPGRCGETRPAAARVELRVRAEQLVSASHTFISALFLRIVIFTCEGSLRSLLASDGVLLRRELLSP